MAMRVYQYDNVLTKKQCNDIIKISDFSSRTNYPGNHVYDADFYVSDPEKPEFEPLILAFKKYHEEYNPNLKRTFINVMRYLDGLGQIVRHQDSNDPNPDIPKMNYTIMIYLNDDFNGGETVFFENDEELTIVPKTGRLLVIPGDIEHEARVPEGGNKYIALARYVIS